LQIQYLEMYSSGYFLLFCVVKLACKEVKLKKTVTRHISLLLPWFICLCIKWHSKWRHKSNTKWRHKSNTNQI